VTAIAHPELEGLERYKFGWADSDVAGESARRGLSEEVVRDISALKDEPRGAADSKSTVKCDALLADTVSRSDTYPYVDIREDDVEMGHEASVSKISEDQLFYLMSRGMTEDEAAASPPRMMTPSRTCRSSQP